MSKIITWLKKELLELIPPMIFFFIVFIVMDIAKGLIERELGITIASTSSAAIGALIVGKSILLVNALPMLKWFHEKRLIYTVLWRIFFYLFIVVFFQFIEELIPLISTYGSFSSAKEHLFKEIKWDHFLAIHILLLLFIIIYTVVTSIVEAFGRKQVRQLFFGQTKKPE